MESVSQWKATRQQAAPKASGIDFSQINLKGIPLSKRITQGAKDIGKEIIKLPIRASLNIGTAIDAARGLMGNEEAGKRAIRIQDDGINSPTFGNLRPIGITGKGFGADVKDVFGAGLEAASYLPIARLPSLGAQALKTSVPTAAKAFAKEGAIAGGIGGAGHEMQSPESTLGSTLKAGAIGTGLGTVLGAGIGAAAPVVGRGLQTLLRRGVEEAPKPMTVNEWKAAGKPAEPIGKEGVSAQKADTSVPFDELTPLPTAPEMFRLKGATEQRETLQSALDNYEIYKSRGDTKGMVDEAAFINKRIGISPEELSKRLSPSIPKELEPLAAEARKYKTAEDFRYNSAAILTKPEFRPLLNAIANPDSPLYAAMKNFDATDFFNKVKGGTPKVSMPSKKVDTGFKSRVYERIKTEHPELEGSVGYTPIKLKQEAEKAVNLIAKDKQEAFDIAMGKKVSDDITSTSVNIALAEKALDEGNINLFTRLVKNRSLAQTRRGQEIVSEKGSVTDNSTSRYVKDLIAMRLDKLGSKYLADIRDLGKKTGSKQRGTNRIEKEVGTLQKNIKERKISMADARELLDALACV